MRVIAYDYAAYRDQIDKSKKRVPVITIILNFSRTEWKTPLSLKDMFHLSEDLDPFVQDYKIHVFNIAFLPKEVRNQFTSDFKIVADYFAERDNPDYQPDTQAIKHVEGVLEMFRVFTDDMRYDMIKSDVIEKRRKGGEVTMCTFVDRMVNLGIEQGIRVLIFNCQEDHVSRQETRQRIVKGFSVSEEEAERELEQCWK